MTREDVPPADDVDVDVPPADDAVPRPPEPAPPAPSEPPEHAGRPSPGDAATGRRPSPARRWLRSLPRRLRDAALALGGDPAAEEPAEVPELDPDLLPLLRELGRALLDAGQSVGDTQGILEEVAAHQGVATVSVVVLPTGLFLRAATPSGTVSDITSATGSGLTLDQIGALFTVVRRLRAGTTSLAEGRAAVRAVRARPPRFPGWAVVLGHGVLTVGFGLILNPSAELLLVYLVLGTAVGALRWLGERWPTLGTALPVVAAFLMTVLAVGVVTPWLGGDPLRTLVPPIVSFLPGAVLTVGAIELTTNQVVAGSSRLVYGVAQLMLLAFGVVAGTAVAGGLTPAPDGGGLGWWAPWVGVVVVGVGQMLFAQTPRRSLTWVLVVLFAAYAAQLAGASVAAPLSGFFGGLVIVPVATLMERTRTGPPVQVTSLPAFWLLVPGSLSFLGLSELVTGSFESAADLAEAVVAVFGIALGMLVGTAVTRDARRVTRTLFTD